MFIILLFIIYCLLLYYCLLYYCLLNSNIASSELYPIFKMKRKNKKILSIQLSSIAILLPLMLLTVIEY